MRVNRGAAVPTTDLLEDLVALLARPRDEQGVFAPSDAQTLERARALATAISRRRADDARRARTVQWVAA